MIIKRPRYKYYADYEAGHLIADNIAQLCYKIKQRFASLITIPENLIDKKSLTDEDMIEWNTIYNLTDPGYFTRNCFTRKRGRGGEGYFYMGHLLNTWAFCNGHEHWIRLGRFLIN